MRAVVWRSRTLAMALVFAAAGFCLALTSPDQGGPGASMRAVGTGTPLRFTVPPVASVPAEFDLGDAAFGSTITRYITAEGGLRPYRFRSEGKYSLANVIEGYQTTLQLGLSGVLAGSLPPRQYTPPPNKEPLPFPAKTVTNTEGFRFQVSVMDAKGTNLQETRTGMFNLFLVDSKIFHFAIDRLPDARLGANYLASLDVVGGRGATTYSLLSAADATTGAPVASNDLGVFLTSDGAVTGCPLLVGVFALKVRCTDSRNQWALSRNQLATDQVFNLIVRDEPFTSSDMLTTQCKVRGDMRTETRDMLSYRGLVNMLGQDTVNLVNSDFTFRLGGVAISGRLDTKGQFATVLADRSIVKVKVNVTRGTVDVTIKQGSFSTRLEAPSLKAGLNRKPVQVTIGDAVACSEVLDFDTDLAGTRYALNYRLGNTGANAAGAFQITSVKGKDGTTLSGLPGDAWRVCFLALPRSGVRDPAGRKQGFDHVSSATVRIGSSFSQFLTGAPLRVTAGGIKFGGSTPDGVRRFVLGTKSFVGRLDTSVLSTKITGIPLASEAPRYGTVFFPLGLDLVRGAGEAPFSGEHARHIFGLKNQYRDQPPKR